MADTKITGLTNFDSSNTPYWPPAPASDVIPIVDISDNTMAASGTTKKISINNLLSSSPTATGALTVTGLVTAGSATITGAATVGTTLGVTGVSTLASAVVTGALTSGTTTLVAHAAGYTGKVGIGTATPADTLDVNGRVTALRYLSSSSNAALPSFAVSAGNGAYSSGANEIGFSINSANAMTLNSTGLLVGTTSDLTGANISSSKGLGTANIATNRFATVEYGSGASGVFTTITVSFTASSANSSVIIEALLSGFSGVYLDHVAGKYGTQTAVVIRNGASVGTTVAALAVDGTGLIYTLTITTAVTHPVIKVKATVGGQGQTTTLPVITFA